MMHVADGMWKILDMGSLIFSQWTMLTVVLIRGLAIVWILGIIWVAKDANERIKSVVIQVAAILLATALGPLWVVIYKILRPPHYRKDLLLLNIMRAQVQSCPKCGEWNTLEHQYCSSCGKKIKQSCKECHSLVALTQEYCSNCWAPNL